MLPINNRKVTAEEMLEQCRRNRQEARVLEGRDHPYVVNSSSVPYKISKPGSTQTKSKGS